MANELARNIQDASLSPAAFALPAAASASTQSTVVDLGLDVYKPERVELQLSIPALSTTIAPDTRTVTLIIETSTTSVFTAVASTILNDVLTGAGGAGIAATLRRVRLPSNCAQYVRGRVAFSASTTEGSALSGTFAVLF